MHVHKRKSILDSYVTHNCFYAAAISRREVYTVIASSSSKVKDRYNFSYF